MTTKQKVWEFPPEGRYDVETYEDRAQWFRGRSMSIGASDSPALVGRSSYGGPYSLWLSKIEGRDEEYLDDNLGEMQEVGLLHEATIAILFERRTGIRLWDPGDCVIFRDPERRHVHATVDRMVDDGDSQDVVEFKCAWFDQAKIWEERVPLSYQIQAQHQLHVTGGNICHFGALLNGYKFRHLIVERDQKFIDRLLERIDEFWFEYVEKRTPPPISGSQHDRDAVTRQHPEAGDDVFALPDEWADLLREYDSAKAEAKKAETRVAEIANRAREAIGDRYAGYVEDLGGFTWSGSGGRRVLRRARNLKPKEVLT